MITELPYINQTYYIPEYDAEDEYDILDTDQVIMMSGGILNLCNCIYSFFCFRKSLQQSK